MNDILTRRVINFMSSEFVLYAGGCFLAPELIAIPSTRVCAVVGLVVEYFWRTSQWPSLSKT